MKKLYVVIVIVIAVGGRFAYKSFKTPVAPLENEQMTGEMMTGEMMTGTEEVMIESSEMEEFTGEFDANEVSVVEGSEDVSVNEGVSAEVDELIEERNIQPSDKTKLTEEDIDLMEQIIQKVQELGK